MSANAPAADLSFQLATQMLELVAKDTPPEVVLIATLTVLRMVAIQQPDQAERVAAVLNHTAAELITGQLFVLTN